MKKHMPSSTSLNKMYSFSKLASMQVWINLPLWRFNYSINSLVDSHFNDYDLYQIFDEMCERLICSIGNVNARLVNVTLWALEHSLGVHFWSGSNFWKIQPYGNNITLWTTYDSIVWMQLQLTIFEKLPKIHKNTQETQCDRFETLYQKKVVFHRISETKIQIKRPVD